MGHLSQQQIDEFRRELTARADRLVKEIRASTADPDRRKLTEITDEVGDEVDDALAVQLSDLNASAMRHQVAELREVNAALRRIDEGVFGEGECEDCGGEIPYERFKANPVARRCTRCQERIENLHGGRDPTPSL